MTRPQTMPEVVDLIEATAAETGFSGVVRLRTASGEHYERGFGWADRRCLVRFEPGTRAGVASVTKGFTALVVMSLVEHGQLQLDTTARSLLGSDLPLVDERVTIRHLIAHRSGIGDYLDEAAQADITDYVLTVPPHRLDSCAAYLAVLEGHPQVSPPGATFAYNNSGFALLAVLAERAAGSSYHDLVDELVCRPAGLTDTGFIRSDSVPAGVATGYLHVDGLRTNVLHMPLIGVGDGGLFTTAADLERLWDALFAGAIVSPATVRQMTTPVSDAPDNDARYGLGFWLDDSGPGVLLEGYDAGISARTRHDPTTGDTLTVISNWSDGAWPILRAVRDAGATAEPPG
jgi:CubicO group peptidase (beta-lactamase class C family)